MSVTPLLRLPAVLLAVMIGSTLCAQELPGAGAMPARTAEAIAAALAAESGSYQPRTKHLQPDGNPRFTNRLILSGSPYLRQHAHNPVNWYAWGDEAFAAARRDNKPVLLSVGYSTCHWCHVMEDESFDNLEIATYLNQNYIAIKVDREERPDIDGIYMAAVQTLTGRGGWPMTVWLTPDRQPYYGGSYFPPYDGERGVREGFLTLLTSLRGVFDNNRDGIGQLSERLMRAVNARMVPPAGDSIPGAAAFEKAFDNFSQSFDAVNGGITRTPKFPSHLPIRFLLRYYRQTGNERALLMAEKTLTSMASGGVYDHVGGGFHRYATDAGWRIPHFEKMLYDNAQLALAYLEAFQVTGNRKYARICRDILTYAARDMRSSGGAFDTATDADSRTPDGDVREGWFYTWSSEEIDAALSTAQASVARAWFDITDEGDLDGRNILRAGSDPLAMAEKFPDLDEPLLASTIADIKAVLYRTRLKRSPPFRDDKILTAWNGLMISAFARSALTFESSDYLETASRAARSILNNSYANGRLKRTFRAGQVSDAAYADDYAYFIQALLDLYEASGDIAWFEYALQLDKTLAAEFEDRDAGGFFFSSADDEAMLTREKPGFDSSTPAVNAVAAMNLLRLYEFTSDDVYRLRAEKTLRFFSTALERSPAAMAEMLRALDFHRDAAKEIVIVTVDGRGDAAPFLDVLRETFLPNHVLMVVNDGEDLQRHLSRIPLLEGKRAIRGETTAFVCEQGICDLPTSDPGVFARQISGGAPRDIQR